MSDLLAAAAAALGAPEHLVERSAAARADAEGLTVEDLLAAWAGGAPAPAGAAASGAAPKAPPSSEPTASAPAAPAAPAAVAAQAAPAAAVAVLPPETAPTAAVSAAPARSKATPILEGRRFHPLRIWTAMAGLFLLGLFITLIGPYNTGGDYRHLVPDPPLSALGEEGRAVYLNQGCGYCHTQLVRPVLADVGLGAATETFSDALDAATFGAQRIGPDLAHVGGRASYGEGGEPLTVDEFIGLLARPDEVFPGGIHPSYAHLSHDELTALATYLTEGLR